MIIIVQAMIAVDRARISVGIAGRRRRRCERHADALLGRIAIGVTGQIEAQHVGAGCQVEGLRDAALCIAVEVNAVAAGRRGTVPIISNEVDAVARDGPGPEGPPPATVVYEPPPDGELNRPSVKGAAETSTQVAPSSAADTARAFK